MLLILIIVLMLVFGLGGNYWNGGAYRGPGLGIGAVLLIVLLVLLFGGGHFGRGW